MRGVTSIYRVVTGILLLWASLAPLRSQGVAAAISGKVLDPSGNGVNGATVTVKSLETGAVRSVTTGETGDYTIVSLPVGPQEVRAEKQGFKTAVRAGVTLTVGQDAVVNLPLEVGELVQQVNVTSEAPVVNTTTSSVSGLVGQNEVKDLPLNGRSWDDLITLNPGTVNYALKSQNTATSNGNTFSVEGHRPSDNLVLLNGVEYTGASQLAITPGGVSGQLLGVEAVREFNVLTDTYNAEYGKRDGAQVSVVTQSGANDLHGSLYEFFRNSAFGAQSYFAQTSIAPFYQNQNQFGAALGGPIQKNKLFLFGNYEGFRLAQRQPNESVVPDDQVRQGLFPNSSGMYTKVTNLNSAMLPYFSFWPEQNGAELLSSGQPSGTALSFASPREHIREDFGTLRSDYLISKRDTLSAAYTIDDGGSLIPLADPLFGTPSSLRMQVASLEETHIISPDILNTFRAGYSRAGFGIGSFVTAPLPEGTSFVAGAGPGGIIVNGGVSTTGTSGITAAGPNNAAGSWNRRNLFTYSDSVRINKGIHQISAGAWFQRVQDNEDSASRQTGVATFTSLVTFLQGNASNFQVVPNPTELGWRSLFGAFYVDDTMKLRPNLTFEAGLRDEFTTGWNEEAGRAANYIPDANGVLKTNPIVGNSAFTKNNATHLLGPRAGLAWDPFKNGKTAIRAGYGMYYSLIDDLSFLLNSLPPYNGSATFSGPLSNYLPIVPSTPVPPACGAGVSPCTTYAPQGIQPDAKTPTVQEWRLTVQQQLSRNSALSVSYIGSHGYYGFVSLDPNSIPAQICSSSAGCLAGGAGSFKSTVAQGAQYIPVSTSRPNPNLSAGFFWNTEGNSSYNALQIDVTKRVSRGLQFRGNYTWSKSLDINSAPTIAQANNQPQMVMDRYDIRRDWGPSALNPAQQASISGTYDLPFGKGRRWGTDLRGAAGKLANGWEFNEIATMLSGFPFTPLIGSNRSGDGDIRNPDRPSLNPNFTGPVILGDPSQWYNPNAFVQPPAGTWGNLGRGVFTGPGLAELDMSLTKMTEITERIKLQFRAEFFNLLNHPNFGAPNATVFSSGKINASAGLINTTTTTAREIQFALKLMF